MKVDRRKSKLTKKQIVKLVVILTAAAVLIAVGVSALRKRVNDQFVKKDDDEVLSAKVTTGSISTSVYGSGYLVDDDEEKIEIPDGVKLKKIAVGVGDKVEQGQKLASINMSSVQKAMADLQDEIDELDEDISAASGDTAKSTVSTYVGGRVKKIYAAPGDDVAAVMYENGALMLLSLDGSMYVDFDADAVSVGDKVTITGSDGAAYPGTVTVIRDNTASVLFTDNGPVYGDTAIITDAEGRVVGNGEILINDPLKITGYTGTVSSVSQTENTQVYAKNVLLQISDTAYTANYNTLLQQRHELEEDMQELIGIYQLGALCAPFSGTVKAIEATDEESADEEEENSTAGYFSISPDETMSLSMTVDETDILSIAVGYKASVTLDSVSGRVFDGEVTEIDRVGVSSSGVSTYTADISVKKTDEMLAGMSASAVISIESVDNAMIIPVDAVNKTSAAYFVYTSYDTETGTLGGMKEVTVGVTNSDYAEIKTGLSVGDTVYYVSKDNQFAMFSGMPGGGMPGGGMPGGNGRSGGGMPGGSGRPGGRP